MTVPGLEPLFGFAVLRPLTGDDRTSGINDIVGVPQGSVEGEIVSVTQNALSNTWAQTRFIGSPGDRVLYNPADATTASVNEDEYAFIRVQDIICQVHPRVVPALAEIEVLGLGSTYFRNDPVEITLSVEEPIFGFVYYPGPANIRIVGSSVPLNPIPVYDPDNLPDDEPEELDPVTPTDS